MYKKRRDVFVPALKKMGWDLNMPDATFYVWARTPKGLPSMDVVSHILEKAHVALQTPWQRLRSVGARLHSLRVDRGRIAARRSDPAHLQTELVAALPLRAVCL